MTPRTRSSNADANPKVYHSRKVPQQAYFPHKRKTVRRRSTPIPNQDEKQQMVFVPDKMRLNQTHVIEDSDDEGDANEIEEENIIDTPKQRIVTKSKKRSRVVIGDDTETEKESAGRDGKRQRKSAASRQKRQITPAVDLSEHENDINPAEAQDQKLHKRRRQSTMTQLVDGRRPLSDEEEPEFKPVKRSPRPGWTGRGKGKGAEKDKQQRTLTQMVSGMRSFEVMSEDDMEEALEDLEAQDRDSQEYDDVVAKRLARQGLHCVEGYKVDKIISDNQVEKGIQTFKAEGNNGDEEDKISGKSEAMHQHVVPSIEDTNEDEEEEDSYRPTQYIDAPATRSIGNSRRRNGLREVKSEASNTLTAKSSTASKSRFGLLRTPEKQRILEIPSSQSPAESLLSAQVSPQKTDRTPLKVCSGNMILAPETPSGRKKVTFHEPTDKTIASCTLKRFQSTIQDSEDDEDISDEDVPSNEQQNRVHTPNQTSIKEKFLDSIAVGADTQAMLEQIDQACANADEDAAWLNRECSEKVDGHTLLLDQRIYTADFAQNQEDHNDSRSHEASEERSHPEMQTTIKKESSSVASVADLPVIGIDPSPEEQDNEGYPTPSHEPPRFRPSAAPRSTPPLPYETYPQGTFPSTPMVIEDESSDEGGDPIEVTPPNTCKKFPQLASATVQHSIDLDGELVQVPASPTLHHETQQSHSSKAEQQLQAEWLSYSQYLGNRPPQQSSMNVGYDTISYNAPFKNIYPSAPKSLPWNPDLLSQATTVDEVTPKKNRTQRIAKVNETPHRIASSPTFSISPIKPPPLFIPSSFPSPGEAGLEGWSSSAFRKTQDGFGYFGSLEDMSIPPPPPAEDD